MIQNPNITPITVQPANPAAGAQYPVLTVPQMAGMPEQGPPSAWWRIECMGLQLVTSATVANRQAQIAIADSLGHQVFALNSSINLVASTTYPINFVVSDAPVAPIGLSSNSGPIIFVPRLWLPSGYTITVNILALQAGDQLSNASYLISQIG